MKKRGPGKKLCSENTHFADIGRGRTICQKFGGPNFVDRYELYQQQQQQQLVGSSWCPQAREWKCDEGRGLPCLAAANLHPLWFTAADFIQYSRVDYSICMQIVLYNSGGRASDRWQRFDDGHHIPQYANPPQPK
jgi:hypothetical protein